MTKRSDQAGFTLVEILAAMAVLMIIVLMLTRVFRDATNAWTIGTRQMEDNINGRAVLDFIARDISTAIAGESNCVFSLQSANANNELRFVSFSGGSGNREARQIVYFVTNDIPNRFCLKRVMAIVDPSINQPTCYTEKNWWESSCGIIIKAQGKIVAENINLFRVWSTGATNDWSGIAYYTTNGLTDYNTSDVSPYMRGKLPVYIDLYLEMLGEDAATKVAQLRSAGLQVEAGVLVSNNVKKFMTRVYFANRTGYALDQAP